MDTKLLYNSKEYQLARYPKTDDKSLRAWSSVELLVLDYITDKKQDNIHLFNDRFGIWNSVLSSKNPVTVWAYASQKKAIVHNLELNNLSIDITYKTPLEDLGKVDLVLMKVPKSLELFEVFLQQIHKSADKQTEVVCGFMTKHFSASFLKIAERYFDEVEQSKAWKKARLLILKEPKKGIQYKELTNEIDWNDNLLQQHYGVFSSGKIDVGTQFLLENLQVQSDELKVLDVASGNGILAIETLRQNSNAQVTLVDDFNLAVASSEMNVKGENAQFICEDNLDDLEKESFDLVISNPPFHFEHENNIEVSVLLFKGVRSCLRKNGRFLLVANSHLNYKTHLKQVFTEVKIVKSNSKFVIYECRG
ncbi:class I SAM-dependent methyltransferase [Tenacibaculum sp. Bg11-29]|uniref:class I SAM-dependent methyltransferase n=1 Tax=Tenacibaculum sp. Bg11-29 TaxID=2058306 RepID=UPI000C3405E0|nr:methyltransferase [Tenacibaculum sp. Bg11-29]PKH52695.1 class I SAM-dependent methyltransferase [Tenacibaculum sp. Bg11-29]